ncbi:MAG: glycerol-3-phosphate 1-O-acyltransferase PlsY [Rickettsiales bacterium]
MTLLSTFALAYFLGSIPFGLLLTRMAGLGDVRAIGSGNIGATNVMRTGRKFLGILTLLLDAGKGALAVIGVNYLYPNDFVPLAALFAMLGHIFPVWLRFKGGKGVATTIGIFGALNPMLGVTVCGAWLLVFLVTRVSSLASLLSIGWSAVMAYVIADMFTAMMCLCMATLVTFTHRENITRLLRGTELAFKKGSV